MRRLIPIVALLLLVGFVTATLAAGDQIYIFNQLYKGRSAKSGGATLVNLDDFLKAAGVPKSAVTLQPSGNTVAGSWHGKAFSAPAEKRDDGVYVNGRALVLGMGGRWEENSQLGLVDVSIPGAYPASTGTAASSTTSVTTAVASASGAPAATDPEAAKNPLKITDFEYVNPALATPGKPPVNYMVTGKLVVKNEAADYVDGVEIVIHLQDGYENDLDTVKKDVGRLEGGQEYSFDWQWPNTTALFINPLAEVQFNHLITKAEREKMAKDKTTPTPDDKKMSVKSRATSGDPAASATTGGGVGSFGPGGPSPTATATSYNSPPNQTMAPPGLDPGSGGGTPSGTATSGGAPPGF